MRLMSLSSERNFNNVEVESNKKQKKENIENSSFKKELNSAVEESSTKSQLKPPVTEPKSKNEKAINEKVLNENKSSDIKKNIKNISINSENSISIKSEEKALTEKKDNLKSKTKKANLDIKLKDQVKLKNKELSDDEIKKGNLESLAGLNLIPNSEQTKIDKKDIVSDTEKKSAKINTEDISKKSVKDLSGVRVELNQNFNKISKDSKDSNTLSKKDKNSDSNLKVKDLRTPIKGENLVQEKNNQIAKADEVSRDKNQEVSFNQENDTESKPDKIITIGGIEVTAEGDGGKTQAPVMKEASLLLKQQLKEFGNNEIVKQSRFILKDKDVGEIKLILKPESLGEVKINLNLKQNSLAGQIVVENNSVREIFQENMANLTKALTDKGYSSADLQLSLNDKGRDGREQQKENKQYFSERLKRIDDSGNVVRYGAFTAGVNLTA